MSINSPKGRKILGSFFLVFGVLYGVLSVVAYRPEFRLLPIVGVISGLLFCIMGYMFLSVKWTNPDK